MFHGKRLGMPYAGWLVGADLLLPNRFTQAEPLARFIAADGRPSPWPSQRCGSTFSAWTRRVSTLIPADDHVRRAAVPRSLIEAYEQRLGVRVVQGLGPDRDEPGRVAGLSLGA